jgi:sterol desaturase/sphingolipid hydroxylase (fatty acid hydroxylase superfamily)
MKRLIQKFGFFVLLLSAAGLFYGLNFSPLAFYGLFVSSLVISYILERYIPYQNAWNQSRDDTKEDAAYAILTILIVPLAKAISVFLVLLVGHWLLPVQEKAAGQSGVVQLLEALLISGILPYWYHRISHTKSDFLWKIHAVHHSPERLYWLNAFRFHPLNAIINSFLSLFPLLLLGFSNETILLAGFINNYVAVLNHANIDFRLGIFNYVFNMNELHRWHHSNNMDEANSNYSGGVLIIWDLVFGTYYNPADRSIGQDEIGLAEESKRSFPQFSIKRQFCYPFCSIKTSRDGV